MTRRKLLLIGAGLVLVALALAVFIPPALAITWGELDVEAKYPEVGAFMVFTPDRGWRRICSGALIHEQVFLTAGHCTDALNRIQPEQVAVSFDLYPLENTDAFHAVSEWHTHPEYRWGPTSDPHDVAVLILEQPVDGISPATLPPEGYLDELKVKNGLKGALFTLVGYGTQLEWPPPSITNIAERRYAMSEYRALTKAWLRMSQNQATGDGGTCGGDSGGPAFYEDGGTRYLVGITSWGDVNCISTGFNYRTDIPQTLDFVADVLTGLTD